MLMRRHVRMHFMCGMRVLYVHGQPWRQRHLDPSRHGNKQGRRNRFPQHAGFYDLKQGTQVK
jgi:hypothetical protein